MNFKIDCSVIVCTYNPQWEKLYVTLKSILIQKKCIFEIVVTDDGSDNNLFELVEKLFVEYDFYNYKLLANSENTGTVNNVFRGLIRCEGDYVKPLSPGDCLHGYHALHDWCEFMNSHTGYVMSYCDAIYYNMSNDKIKILRKNANPQSRKLTVKKYLMYRDFCLGAATIVRKDKWIDYLEMIRDKVIYTEDASYQIMIYCGEKFIHMPKTFVLYEYGFGVTTSGSKKWIERIKKDETMVNNIISTIKPCYEAENLNVIEYLKIRDTATIRVKIKKIMCLPSLIAYRMKHKLLPRKTAVDVDNDFINVLLN